MTVPAMLPSVICRLRQNGSATSSATTGGTVAINEIQYQFSPVTMRQIGRPQLAAAGNAL